MTNQDIIDKKAYLAGFEPSSDNLSGNALFAEQASDYLMLAMTF